MGSGNNHTHPTNTFNNTHNKIINNTPKKSVNNTKQQLNRLVNNNSSGVDNKEGAIVGSLRLLDGNSSPSGMNTLLQRKRTLPLHFSTNEYASSNNNGIEQHSMTNRSNRGRGTGTMGKGSSSVVTTNTVKSIGSYRTNLSGTPILPLFADNGPPSPMFALTQTTTTNGAIISNNTPLFLKNKIIPGNKNPSNRSRTPIKVILVLLYNSTLLNPESSS